MVNVGVERPSGSLGSSPVLQTIHCQSTAFSRLKAPKQTHCKQNPGHTQSSCNAPRSCPEFGLGVLVMAGKQRCSV